MWEESDPYGIGGGSDTTTQLWTVYDGANAWADFTGGSTTPTMRYLNGTGMDQRFAREDGSGNVAWYLTDNINSVRQVVQTDGTVLDAINYTAFGSIASETAPASGDRFKYTGREWDAGTGQYYYRARYYGAGVGRFLSEDLTGFAAGDANLYRYVNNKPSIFVDPSGRFLIIGSIVVGGIVIGILLGPGAGIAQAPTSPTDIVVPSLSTRAVDDIFCFGEGYFAGGLLERGLGNFIPSPAVPSPSDPAPAPALPKGPIGNNPRPGSGGTKSDLPGGQNAANDLFNRLTGGKSCADPNNPGRVVGSNGVGMRIGKGKDTRPRIDIPAHGDTPPETIHFNP